MRNVGQDFASPVTTDAKKILWPGVGITALLLLEKKNAAEPLQESVATRQPLGSTSKFGDNMGKLIPNAIYAGSMWAYGYFKTSDLANERAWVMTKATIYSAIVTDVLKVVVHKERPDHSNYQSFPSGHTTTAFAFASVVHAEHGWLYGAPAYALASFVGFSRINDNKHDLNDVFAGAVVGTVYGIGLHYRSLQDRPRTQAQNFDYSVLPVIASNFAGVSAYAEF